MVQRRVRPAPVELADERRRCPGIGEDRHLGPGPGERHVEHPPLALLVAGQPVGEEALRGSEHQHPLPLLALDPVHGGQEHRRSVGLGSGQHTPQPVLEGGRLGVERGDRFESNQVVGVSGAVCLPP